MTRPQSYTYYALLCQACGASLSFGQTREGERLFPKRDKGTRGWEIYQGGQHEQPQQQSGQHRNINYNPREPLPY